MNERFARIEKWSNMDKPVFGKLNILKPKHEEIYREKKDLDELLRQNCQLHLAHNYVPAGKGKNKDDFYSYFEQYQKYLLSPEGVIVVVPV
jgi:flavodoxin